MYFLNYVVIYLKKQVPPKSHSTDEKIYNRCKIMYSKEAYTEKASHTTYLNIFLNSLKAGEYKAGLQFISLAILSILLSFSSWVLKYTFLILITIMVIFLDTWIPKRPKFNQIE